MCPAILWVCYVDGPWDLTNFPMSMVRAQSSLRLGALRAEPIAGFGFIAFGFQSPQFPKSPAKPRKGPLSLQRNQPRLAAIQRKTGGSSQFSALTRAFLSQEAGFFSLSGAFCLLSRKARMCRGKGSQAWARNPDNLGMSVSHLRPKEMTYSQQHNNPHNPANPQTSTQPKPKKANPKRQRNGGGQNGQRKSTGEGAVSFWHRFRVAEGHSAN